MNNTQLNNIQCRQTDRSFLFFKVLTTLLLFISIVFNLPAQSDFRKAFKSENRATDSLDLTRQEKLVLHQRFLDSVENKGDKMRIMIGNLYVFTDKVKLNQLAEATPYLLRAESLAENSGEASWIGTASYYRGFFNTTRRNFSEALENYLVAADNCCLSADSLCMAQSYEQVSAMYGKLRKVEEAQTYLNLALPILKKLGNDDHLGIAYNNYATLLFVQKRHEEAIVYIRKSIELHKKTGRKSSWVKAKHNLANNQRKIGLIDEAIAGFEECITFNRENNFRGNIITNYSGLRATYQSIGDYESAYLYYRKYTALKDSINGEKTGRKISSLTMKFKEAENELSVEKERVKLLSAKESLRRTLTLLSGLALAALLGIIGWVRQSRRSKLRFVESSKKLASLTRLLIEKNSAIKELMDQQKAIVKSESDEATGSASENVFEQTILTDTDWQEFKTYFESKYPGYIFKLRKAYPELTEAEERLFLLIKTSLTPKEIAALLGISYSSVKKSRNRLRKRLELSPEASLEKFIHEFKTPQY